MVFLRSNNKHKSTRLSLRKLVSKIKINGQDAKMQCQLPPKEKLCIKWTSKINLNKKNETSKGIKTWFFSMQSYKQLKTLSEQEKRKEHRYESSLDFAKYAKIIA